jgi:hypothetical protein
MNKIKFIILPKQIKNILLQRNELLSNSQKYLRKLFGRFLFTKLFIYFFRKKNIEKLYFQRLEKEYYSVYYLLKNCKKKNYILSIGCGLGGLEVLIHNRILNNAKFYLFERNFTSSKVVYGFDLKNKEAYNSIEDTKLFINNNSFNKSNFFLFDVDNDNLPKIKFDVIISLLSLDYHYPFDLYYKYLKKNSHKSTIFIFDTGRPSYFKKIFKVVKIISQNKKKIHSSTRIICKNFC